MTCLNNITKYIRKAVGLKPCRFFTIPGAGDRFFLLCRWLFLKCIQMTPSISLPFILSRFVPCHIPPLRLDMVSQGRDLSLPAWGMAVAEAAICLSPTVTITALLSQLQPSHMDFTILVSWAVRVSQSACSCPKVRITSKLNRYQHL